MKKMRVGLVLLMLAGGVTASRPGVPHYRLAATIDPPSHTIRVVGFFRDERGKETPVRVEKTIDEPIAREGEDYARGFSETAGAIGPEGVFLSGRSGWYPHLTDGLFTFEVTVRLPTGWTAVSQGRVTPVPASDNGVGVRFVADDPQEEIWLVAGRFVETARTFDQAQAVTLLRERDDALSSKYLDATGSYLSMYAKLIGPYPYSRFALVENFWETGYGMPSFTLLGSKVIRLPFILTTSYPHEILHNWWGNGVYVAEEGGNWSEGLTAYLADHLFAERTGGGAAYRQETLQKYVDYASKSKDFPLSEFRERHSPATEAVGYGKALMLFHMLRRELGDETFTKGLRALYATRKFHRASFDDVMRAFEAASGRDLASAFTPWVSRVGAPRLRVTGATAKRGDDGTWSVSGTIEQTQTEPPYTLAVPMALTVEGSPKAVASVLRVKERATPFSLSSTARPLRLDVDPEFDLFRKLDVEEAPPALSSAFGADACTMILPASADPQLGKAYRALADEWNTGRSAPMRVVDDAELTALPKDGSVWVVGFENRFVADAAAALVPYGSRPERSGDRAIIAAARRARGQAPVIVFLGAARAAQVPGLARKLPHYHKYSHLAFEGDEPVNVEKGRFTVVGSPMTAMLAGGTAIAALPTRAPLADLPPAFSKDRMMETVRMLAAPAMRGRGRKTPELAQAAAAIAAAMKAAGLEVLPVDAEMPNVIGVLRGTKPEWSEESVVVGAHYDHLGIDAAGTIHPGADDNASGVAVLLELARQLASDTRASRTIVFAAFADEESGLAGSKTYVSSSSAWPARKALGVVNLDTVGRLFAGKVLVLGSGSADEWIHIVNGAGYVTGAPVEAVMSDPGGSDQKSFTDAGVPAVQLFTGPHADYHGPGDTPDKIDGDGLVKVASVAREMVAYLAERPTPLTSKLAVAPPATGAGGATARRVSLGTIPDYAFAGPGVRISGTTPGSPAETAGLMAGDVLVKLGTTGISTLREFAEALKVLTPGTPIPVTYRRGETERSVDVTPVAR